MVALVVFQWILCNFLYVGSYHLLIEPYFLLSDLDSSYSVSCPAALASIDNLVLRGSDLRGCPFVILALQGQFLVFQL